MLPNQVWKCNSMTSIQYEVYKIMKCGCNSFFYYKTEHIKQFIIIKKFSLLGIWFRGQPSICPTLFYCKHFILKK